MKIEHGVGGHRSIRAFLPRRGLIVAVLAVVPAVVCSGGAALASTCDGVWRFEPGPSLDNVMTDVAVAGPGEVWAIESESVISHRLAGVWHTTAFPPGYFFSGVSAVPGAAWVVGNKADHPLSPLAMEWTGDRWLPRQIGAVTGDLLDSVEMRSSRDVWIAGFNVQGEVVLHFDGSHWRRFSLPGIRSGGSYPGALVERNASDVWVIGVSTVPPPGCGDLAAAEHWDGSRWRVAALPRVCDSPLTRGDVTAAGKIWAVGAECGRDPCRPGTVATRTSAGWTVGHPLVPVFGGVRSSRWQPTDVVASDEPGGTSIVGNYFFVSGAGVRIAAPEIQTWTGQRWTRQTISGLHWAGGASLIAVDGRDHGDRYALGYVFDTQRPFLAHQCIA